MNNPTMDPRFAAALRKELAVAVTAPTAAKRGKFNKLLIGAGGLAIAVGGASFLAPGAYADWTPLPEQLTPVEAAVAAQSCVDLHTESANHSQNDPTFPDANDWNVGLVERRGDWDVVLLSTDSGYIADCLTGERSDSAGSSDDPHAKPGTDSITVLNESSNATDTSLWESGPRAEGHHMLFGWAGDDVTGIVIHAQKAGDVTATVDNGFWVSWWPISTFGFNLSYEDDPVLGATLTMADGDVVEVSQEEWAILRNQ